MPLKHSLIQSLMKRSAKAKKRPADDVPCVPDQAVKLINAVMRTSAAANQVNMLQENVFFCNLNNFKTKSQHCGKNVIITKKTFSSNWFDCCIKTIVP